MKKRLLAMLLCLTMVTGMAAGCSSQKNESAAPDTTEAETAGETVSAETEPQVDNASAVPEKLEEIAAATADEVTAFMEDSDEKTVLLDARAQEAYAGWSIDGAANGGHLKNAGLFSARWLDCSIRDSRTVYLKRAMESQKVTADSSVIVYDYNGTQANVVANYLKGQGVNDVKIFNAKDMIDAGKDVVSYENYDRFLPTEIVKSVSDVMTGKAAELTAEAKAVFPDGLDKVVLVDCGWGNAKNSSYFSLGHVPGAVHINTDSYERPRVYVPEKRSEYAKEWRLIPLDEFRDTVCPQYGITKDSTVIITGASSSPIGRLGFMLRSLGVKVYGMTGCLTVWRYNGYELDTDVSTLVIPTAADSFGSSEIACPDEILWDDTIEKILSGEMEGYVADNRGKDEWDGLYSGYSYHDLAGHPDGAIWCTQGDEGEGNYFQNVDATPRTKEEYVAYMESKGLDTSKTIAFFCGDSWGAAAISYWCQSTDLNTIKQWGSGWIPWSNNGHEFVDHNGKLVHYDKYLDAVLDQDGNVVSDGVNILADEKAE